MSAASRGPEFTDANIIVRYLTKQPPELAERARSIIEGHPGPLFISEGTLSETAYVLTRHYGIPRHEVVDALIDLINRSNIRVHQIDKPLVIQALLLCQPSGRVSFADAMLWAVARSSGSRTTIFTFDRRFPSIGIHTRDFLSGGTDDA